MHLLAGMLPPVVTDADRELVARQLGREPRTLHGVAVRCPFGAPAVTEQSPYAADGEPFPTTYYLTCRHLVAAVSRLEAVARIEGTACIACIANRRIGFIWAPVAWP